MLLVHHPNLVYPVAGDTVCGYGAALVSCDSARTRIDGDDNSYWIWKIYAAFPSESSPRLKALDFGVNYDPYDPNNNTGSLVVLDHGPCIGDAGNGAQEFPGGSWPAPGSGTVLVFQYTQTDPLVETYWFSGYAYYGAPGVFELTKGQFGTFADDSVPAQADSIADYGRLGFNTDGYSPCASWGEQAQGGGMDGPGQNGVDQDGPGQNGVEGGGLDNDSSADAGDLTFVEMATSTDSAYASTYRALKGEYGLRVLVGMMPDGLVCRTHQEQRGFLSADSRVSLLTTETIPTALPNLQPGDQGYAENVWNSMLTPSLPDSSGAGGSDSTNFVDDRTYGRDQPYQQTASYMMGDVGVSLFFLESSDGLDCDRPGHHYHENWSPAGIVDTFDRIHRGLDYLSDLEPSANLTFHIEDPYIVPISFEPVDTVNEEPYITQTMNHLNVPPASSYLDRWWTFNNTRRSDSQLGFDWWISNFVVNDSCHVFRHFPDTTSSWAHGQGAILLRFNGWEAASQLDLVTSHETGHVFGAPDEDVYTPRDSCAHLWSYLQEPNGNSKVYDPDSTCDGGPQVPCLMRGFRHGVGFDSTLCRHSLAQVGWRDTTHNTILDPIDHYWSGRSALVGVEDALGFGDYVDIFSMSALHLPEEWVKRLPASQWSMNRGCLLWDGIDYAGNPRPCGIYGWQKNSQGICHDSLTLHPDTLAPTVYDVTLNPGTLNAEFPGDLSFRFLDGDTHGGRVRAVAQKGIRSQTIFHDEFFRERHEWDPPVERSFALPDSGYWSVTLRLWDVGAGQVESDTLHFCSPVDCTSGVSGSRIYLPELALSRGRPNPSSQWVSWDLDHKSAGKVDLRVIGVDGRCLKSWSQRHLPPGRTQVLWDGRDNRGARVPSGRYYLVVSDERGHRQAGATTIVR